MVRGPDAPTPCIRSAFSVQDKHGTRDDGYGHLLGRTGDAVAVVPVDISAQATETIGRAVPDLWHRRGVAGCRRGLGRCAFRLGHGQGTGGCRGAARHGRSSEPSAVRRDLFPTLCLDRRGGAAGSWPCPAVLSVGRGRGLQPRIRHGGTCAGLGIIVGAAPVARSIAGNPRHSRHGVPALCRAARRAAPLTQGPGDGPAGQATCPSAKMARRMPASIAAARASPRGRGCGRSITTSCATRP